jgi:DNA-binding XRE family transcriptional regulator
MANRDIGARVKVIREARRMTTTDLARRVGISQAQISRLENGLQGFRPSTGSGPELVVRPRGSRRVEGSESKAAAGRS